MAQNVYILFVKQARHALRLIHDVNPSQLGEAVHCGGPVMHFADGCEIALSRALALAVARARSGAKAHG